MISFVNNLYAKCAIPLELKRTQTWFQIPVFLLLFLQIQVIHAQELRQMQVEELGAETTIIDRADRGLLIVESTIPDLKFVGSNRPIPAEPGVREMMPGVWHVYLSTGTTLLTIQADGYLAQQDIRINLQPRQAKKIRITPKQILGAYGGFDENRPEIRLKYIPESEGEKVFGGLDGNVMKLDFSSGMRSFRPSSGRHVIKLNSQGRIWEKSYDLKPGDVVEDAVTFSSGKTERWDIKEPGGLDISSDPPGATVFIDQVNQGTTPLILDDIQPGTYQIELVKDLYLAESRTVVVKSLDYTPLSVDLTPNFGRVKIESDPPEAMVWINDQQKGLTPYEVPRFNAGKYALRLVKSLYYEETDTFEIKPGGEYVNLYKLKPQFGKVSLSSEPPNATVTVDGQLWGNTPLTRDKVLSGEHILKLSHDNYFDEEAVIRISDGQHFEKQYKLRPRVGWLTVKSDPPGADVTITETNQSLGKTPLTRVPIDRGTYRLLIEKDLYEPFETAIGLTYGGEQNVEAELQRSVGHIRVSVEPRGTKIYLNNEYKGESPTVVKDVPTGSYELRLEKSGYDIQIDRVQVNRNEVTKYSMTLGTAGTVKWKRRRAKARLLSIAVPGGGQFLSKQYIRGGLYASAFLGGLAMAYLATIDHDDAKKDYWKAVDAYHASADQRALNANYLWVQSASKKMKDAEDRYLYSLAAVGGVYTLQLLDAWLWGGGKRPVAGQLGYNPPYASFAMSDGGTIRLGVKVEF